MTHKIAVVRVRGQVRLHGTVRQTFKQLNLNRKNNCIIVDEKSRGMINKVKDYVTWGEISDEVVALLKNKKGKTYLLKPPKGGYGRKGVKVAFANGGALGNRNEKINDLIKRMV